MKKIQKNISLSKYTTLSIGGSAKYFVVVKTKKELVDAMNFAKKKSLDTLILGGGSNLLIGEKGFNGIVIKNEIKGIQKKKNTIIVESGEVLDELITYLSDNGLAGMEKMAGIPGSVGGAIRGNAGAYGQTISDCLVRVKILEEGRIKWISHHQGGFGYRDSIFKKENFIILGAEFILRESDKKELEKTSEKIIKLRAIKYEPSIKCPGSFFKNVLVKDLSKKVLSKISKDFIMYGKIPAGQLLEAVGANGKSLGGIKIADHHGNLFVNTGKGTASEFCELSEKYALKVKEKFGIELEPEVQLVGCDENNNVEKYREKYPEFTYENYNWMVVGRDLILSFSYKIKSDIDFNHEIVIKNIPSTFEKFDKNSIDLFVFNIGMVELFSYWKTTASPIISIKAGFLDDFQKKWWFDLLINGMGQYFFENDINFLKDDFVRLEISGKKILRGKTENDNNGSLIAIGGGVDSAVSLDLISKEDSNVGVFVVNPSISARKTIEKSNIKETIVVERKLDKKIIELNKKGYLNGHIPFSASLAFISVFCASIFGYKDLVFSNEQSSNEENVKYLGKNINHQYSKTFEFEKNFREYNKKHLSDINYFSFLRPLYELQILRIFSSKSGYFDLIRSCNVGQKTNKWCCKCSKCLSTFILLSPFLDTKKMISIFSKNMFADESLKSLVLDLTLDGKVKPFECVGTREELRAALFLSVDKHDKDILPPLLKVAKEEVLSKNSDLRKEAKNILSNWSKNNFLSGKYEKILKSAL